MESLDDIFPLSPPVPTSIVEVIVVWGKIRDW